MCPLVFDISFLRRKIPTVYPICCLSIYFYQVSLQPLTTEKPIQVVSTFPYSKYFLIQGAFLQSSSAHSPKLTHPSWNGAINIYFQSCIVTDRHLYWMHWWVKASIHNTVFTNLSTCVNSLRLLCDLDANIPPYINAVKLLAITCTFALHPPSQSVAPRTCSN